MSRIYLLSQTDWVSKFLAVVFGCFLSYGVCVAIAPWVLLHISLYSVIGFLCFLPIIVWLATVVHQAAKNSA